MADMATLTISDKVAALAQARAAQEGYSNVEDYLEALLLGEPERPGAAPEHLTVRSHAQLVALVREGLASPAREMTAADFDRMRAELAARHGTAEGA